MESLSKLDQKLIELGILTKEEVRAADEKKRTTGEPLEQILLETKAAEAPQQQAAAVSQADKQAVLAAKAKEYRIEAVDLTARPVEKDLVEIIPQDMAKRYRVVCIGKKDNKITLAMSDPTDVFAMDDVKFRLGYDVVPVYAVQSDIEAVQKQIYGEVETWKEMFADAEELDSVSVVKDEEKADEAVVDAPVIRLVNSIISEAIEKRASDIHIECFEKDLLVRYRIDGVLHEIMSPPKPLLPAMISRMKIMANLKIDEKRVPQDGRIKMSVKEREIDLRVSTVPTLFGESVVMRILDRANLKVELTQLGFSPRDQEKLKRLVEKPHGIFLVTGPTGSGKSTSLYATLNALNKPDVKILTVEDPVEYYLRGIVQVQTNHRVGLDFARALRAFLRQDPDIIMVGEIRDKETGTIAVESALTGHFVLSTLHTNDTIGRATCVGILAQRLVRRICKECKEEVKEVPDNLLKIFQENNIPTDKLSLAHGRGCPVCNETGYKGRVGIYELLEITEQLRAMILKQESPADMWELAKKQGTLTLYEDGLEKVAQGATTYEELFRVTSGE
ncbi:MAG: Flp pilus assembly complex ATPase component TadA [Armatimonadetes bacterium]|nr:Flp pilus assembly complex ATPase component TadA [Armatimonadota bacterium]